MQRILLFVLFGLISLSAVADGKLYSRQTALAVDVTIPDQRALIHYTNGMQRLVIETRFVGAGTNFAWVIPLPSPPVIEAATTGLFPTLQHLFRPTITHRVPRYYLFFVGALGMLVILAVLVRYGGSFYVGVGIILAAFLAVTLLVPTLGKAPVTAGFGSEANAGVSILDRILVGVFETTTLTARDPQALQDWLRENEFSFTTNSAPVIADYVQDGWVFVAAKVQRETAELQSSTPHPLSFTFATDRPVYPLRLTGVDNGPLRVDLYIFGARRAQAANFKVERCVEPQYATALTPTRPRSGKALSIGHPQLLSWVGGAPVATKLTATLTPEQMRRDVWIEWQEYEERQKVLFSRKAARTVALNWASGVLLVGLLLSQLMAVLRRSTDRWLVKASGVVLGASLVVATVVFVALPKVGVKLVRFAHYETRQAHFFPYLLVTGEPLDIARQMLAQPTNFVSRTEWNDVFRAGQWPNHHLGGVIREEDSPGNFILREKDGQVEYVIYDDNGAEQVEHRWTPQARP
jgi:hypothetical protein